MALVRKRLTEISEGVALSSGCTISAKMTDTYPAVINDSELFKTILSHLTCSKVVVKPKMFAEDFSYYQKKVPGLFAFVGTRNDALNLIHPLHSCFFNLNEEALLAGVDFYTQVLSMMD
jgi:metal-dependent amidase/aminoacylase/carboxypeptidase family protein